MSVALHSWKCDRCLYSIEDERDVVDEAKHEHMLSHSMRDAGIDPHDDPLPDGDEARTGPDDKDRAVESAVRSADARSGPQADGMVGARPGRRRQGTAEVPPPVAGSPPIANDANHWHEWTKDEVVASLKSYAGALGHTPTTTDWMKATHRRPALNTIKRLFGSWTAALDEAELPRRKAGRPSVQVSRARTQVASETVDIVDAAKHVKACKDELARLETKRAQTEALLQDALQLLAQAVEQEQGSRQGG